MPLLFIAFTRLVVIDMQSSSSANSNAGEPAGVGDAATPAADDLGGGEAFVPKTYLSTAPTKTSEVQSDNVPSTWPL